MKIVKVIILSLLAIMLNGCMSFSGDRLAELQSITPQTTPQIEHSVGDFTFHLDGGQMVTDNYAGKLLNDTICKKWEANDYISGFTYRESENFTGNAQYNLTLKGHQEGKSSVAMQVISGLTLLIIPHWVDTSYDLVYELENVQTGDKYETAVSEDMLMVNWLGFLPAFPFSFVGANNTYDRLSEHAYQDFVKQGAFSNSEIQSVKK